MSQEERPSPTREQEAEWDGALRSHGGVRSVLGARLFRRTFPVAAIVVLVTLGGLGFLTWNEQRLSLERRATIVAELTAEAIARPLWYLDRTVLEPQVLAVGRDADFRFARVLDDQGEIFFQTGDAAELERSDAIAVRRNVLEPGTGDAIGEVLIVVSSNQLDRMLGVLLVTGGIAFLVLIAGFALASHAAVRELVVQPLSRLLAAMRQVQQKEWTKVDQLSSDEIGEAGAVFNEMVEGLRAGDDAQRLLAALREAQAQLIDKNEALEKANRLVMESIQYARRIQEGILPDTSVLEPSMSEVAILWEPLSVVGGDYCWLERRDGKSILIVADCTGHGVPGAFMTLIVASALERILDVETLPAPDEILTALDEMVRRRLRQDEIDGKSDDGLDAAVCILDEAGGELAFAGAGIPLLMLRNGEIEQIRAVRRSLGYRTLPPPDSLPVHRIPIEPGDSFYLFSDGVPDHVGGAPRRTFGRRRVAEALAERASSSLEEQISHMKAKLDAFRDGEPRRDDVTLIAFRPNLVRAERTADPAHSSSSGREIVDAGQ